MLVYFFLIDIYIISLRCLYIFFHVNKIYEKKTCSYFVCYMFSLCIYVEAEEQRSNKLEKKSKVIK